MTFLESIGEWVASALRTLGLGDGEGTLSGLPPAGAADASPRVTLEDEATLGMRQPAVASAVSPPVTPEQLAEIMPRMTTRPGQYLALVAAMTEFAITTPLRAAAFLAQVAHESGEFRWLEELASGDAYEGRVDLGNAEPGDGRRYKGRGPIQLTGRANYARCGQALWLDLLSDPAQVATPEVGFRAAGWYWTTHGLNELADRGDADAFRAITRRINGGLNGLAQREAYYARAKVALGVAQA